MDVVDALLESWDRQARMVENVAALVNESNRNLKPSEEGWPLDHHLAHIHKVRQFWLSKVSPNRAAGLRDSFVNDWEDPIQDLATIKANLEESNRAICEAIAECLKDGVDQVGGYDHPVLFLQHMIWHEGWHVGLLFLGLRRADQEPSEEWEEKHIWGLWRSEE